MKYSKAAIEALINGIYDGTISEYNIPEPLYFAIADYLKEALYTGYGGGLSDFSGTDYALLDELRTNVYMFSAAKCYTELKVMSGLLVDDDKVRSFREFKKAAMHTFDIYNVDYLKSEYNTALASGEMAIKWQDVERNKDILPLLQYQTKGGEVCPICKPLDGVVLPATSAFWKTRYPPNHFNCYCIVTQHEEDELPITKDVPDTLPLMQDTFKMNVGRDKYIFAPDHPYFDVPKSDKSYAMRNFDLPIPDKDLKGSKTAKNIIYGII